MRLSVAIPAYNRPDELKVALTSLAPQVTGDIEIVISEDCSPRKAEIKSVVDDFRLAHPGLQVRYFSNTENLGYDGNLRSLLDKAVGDYVFFMGDDDRIPAGALAKVLWAISHPNIGVVLRAWRSYDGETEEILDTHHYFSGDRLFPASRDTVAAFFRRSVFISGLTLHRLSSRALHTEEFDGLLLYQLYLVGKLLMRMNGFYLDSIVAERRCGGEHFFGSSASEAGRFEPRKLEIDHSVGFISGMFQIAEYLERQDAGVLGIIRRDLGRYSYPMLEIQAVRRRRAEFFRYGIKLAGLGLRAEPFFWIYFSGLLVLGPRLCRRTIEWITRRMGRTPILAGTAGTPVQYS